MTAERGRIAIGWNEYVSLPDWGVSRLRAKVDTGARSSALHVENIELRSPERVAFQIVPARRKARRIRVEAPVSRTGRVRSSTGEYTWRIFVPASIRLGAEEWTIELSLVDRGDMVFRMLLGRTALAGRFVVDVSRRMTQGKPPRSAPRTRPG